MFLPTGINLYAPTIFCTQVFCLSPYISFFPISVLYSPHIFCHGYSVYHHTFSLTGILCLHIFLLTSILYILHNPVHRYSMSFYFSPHLFYISPHISSHIYSICHQIFLTTGILCVAIYFLQQVFYISSHISSQRYSICHHIFLLIVTQYITIYFFPQVFCMSQYIYSYRYSLYTHTFIPTDTLYIPIYLFPQILFISPYIYSHRYSTCTCTQAAWPSWFTCTHIY